MATTHPFEPEDGDHLKEECGVFGIIGDREAGTQTALGLHALQHRGQEAAGMVTFDGVQFNSHRGMGQVAENFGSETVMERLKGDMAIGHTRYATTGGTILRNVQPLFAELDSGGFAIAHNGNLTNALTLRQELKKRGCLFQSTSDTEVVIHLMAISDETTFEDRLVDALRQVEGAYSFVCLTPNAVIGARDPLGVRPLVLGRLDNAWILCSESCALDIIGGEFVRDVEPGEVVILSRNGAVRSLKPFPKQHPRFCIFEYIYFARPDTVSEGHSVYEVRKSIGAQLAKESPVDADIIVPVPDSGVAAALGYSAVSGVPFEMGIIRSHYVGRTFIQPTAQSRHSGVRRKHNPNRAVLEGKRVVLVDDSIVRGTTSKEIVQMAREAGANKVYLASAAPPVRFPNVYGIDMPTKEELIAHGRSIEEVRQYIGADALIYQDVDAMKRVVAALKPGLSGFEASCFDGTYITGDVSAEDFATMREQRQSQAEEEDGPARTRLALQSGQEQ